MSHWRSLLFLAFLANSAFGANIQGIPTPTMFQRKNAIAQFNSSYDGMTHYTNTQALNGLTNANPATLGASFQGSAYVSQFGGAPGVLAYDNTVFDPVGSPINGLAGPVGWSGNYVGSANHFPGITFDTMASYQAPAFLDTTGTLNGGADNGAGLIWTGGYIGGNAPPLPGTCTPFGQGSIAIASLGTTITDSYYAGSANPGIQGGWFGMQFLPTRDFLVTGLGVYNLSGQSGSCPNTYAVLMLTGGGNQVHAFAGLTGATGTFAYGCLSAAFLCKAGVPYNLVALESSSGGCSTPFPGSNTVTAATYIGVQGPYTFSSCVSDAPYFVAATNTSFIPLDLVTDEGITWSNQVVVNGGAAPSVADTAATSTFARGVIADGNFTNILALSLFAPDNLTAALTPIPALNPKSAAVWANSGFVGGDLTVNGLQGNGTKNIPTTGFTDSTGWLNPTNMGLFVYYYTAANEAAYAGSVITADFLTGGLIRGNNVAVAAFHSYDGGISGTDIGNGFYIGERTANNATALYAANSTHTFAAIATGAGATNHAFQAVNAPVFTLTPSVALTSASLLSAYGFTAGMSGVQASNLYVRVQAVRTSYGGGFR